MTYTANEIKQHTLSFKVKFKVEMYVNEVLTDTYIENYSFVFNALKKIDKILDVKSEMSLKLCPWVRVDRFWSSEQTSLRFMGSALILKNKIIMAVIRLFGHREIKERFRMLYK